MYPNLTSVALACGMALLVFGAAAPEANSGEPAGPSAPQQTGSTVPEDRSPATDLPRLPLQIQEAGTFSALGVRRRFPAVAVGCLPTGTKPPASLIETYSAIGDIPNATHLLMDGYSRGTLQLQPARADAETWVFLTDRVNSDFAVGGPAEINRKGNVITLIVENWTHNGVGDHNIPLNRFRAFSLNMLREGDYELRVEYRNLLHDWAKTRAFEPQRHSLSAVHQVSLKFHVGTDNNSADAKATMTELPVPETAKTVLRQPPQAQLRRFASAAIGSDPLPGLYAAGFKLEALNPPDLKTLPRIPEQGANEGPQPSWVSVLSPDLNSGEWLALREITWNGNQATLRVELWRDDLPRMRNLPSRHLMVIPLSLIVPGTYTVAVEWIPLKLSGRDNAYQLDLPSQLAFAKYQNQAILNVAARASTRPRPVKPAARGPSTAPEDF